MGDGGQGTSAAEVAVVSSEAWMDGLPEGDIHQSRTRGPLKSACAGGSGCLSAQWGPGLEEGI